VNVAGLSRFMMMGGGTGTQFSGIRFAAWTAGNGRGVS
jgi:hypothetical protein